MATTDVGAVWLITGAQASGKSTVAYRDGFTPAINDEHVAATRRDLGLWLDTSDLSAMQTVDEILRRADEAVIR